MKLADPYTPIAGGLDLSSTPGLMNPSHALLALNYELDENGHPRSLKGYSIVGGNALPGIGSVLGLTIYKGQIYGIREDAGIAKLHKCNSGAWSEVAPITGSLPLGKYESTTATFDALDSSEVMLMQCADTGKPWILDSTSLRVIESAPEGGKYLTVHEDHMFLGFGAGSVQHSSVGNPEDWDGANGASEIGVSDSITGFASVTSALAIMCKNSIQTLYGNLSANWRKEFHSGSGVTPYTSQSIGGSAVFLGEAGLSSLDAVNAFGNFALGNWGESVNPLLNLPAKPTCSVLLKKKNQYWIFFDNGTALICRYFGGKTWGITTAAFPHVVSVATAGEINNSEEIIIGTDDGYIFQLNSGTSFNGSDIQTTLAIAYNHFKSRTVRKHFNRIFLDLEAESKVNLSILPQFDYGDEAIARHLVLFKEAAGKGGQWGIDNWGEFSWGAALVDQTKVDCVGSAIAVSLIINTQSNNSKPHTITGYTTHFTSRRHIRG